MLALLSQVGAQVVNGDRSELRHDSIMLTPVSIMQAPASSLTTFVARCPDRAANFAHLAGAGMHYVGSLPPSSFPALLAVPARRRHPVDPHKYPGLSAYDTRTLVFGADRRVVLTHSANLHTKQGAGFDQTLAKTTRDLGELAAT